MSVLCVAKARNISKDALGQYREKSGMALAKYGAHVVKSSPSISVIEGNEASCDVIAILEFPDEQSVQDWYHDQELASVHELRAKSGDWSIMMLGG